MRRLAYYLTPIALCFLVGFSAMLLQEESLSSWYPLLNKPSITPPDGVFPIAWSIIYICMGLSIGRLMDVGHGGFVWLWLLQLVLNFLWSPMFFTQQSPLSGLVVIIFLDVAVLTYTILAWPASKFSSIIMLPYLAWLSLATYLNLYIWLNN